MEEVVGEGIEKIKSLIQSFANRRLTIEWDLIFVLLSTLITILIAKSLYMKEIIFFYEVE